MVIIWSVFYFYKSVLPGAQTNGAVEVFIKPGSHTHVLDSVLQITDEPVHSSLQSHDESRGFSERNKLLELFNEIIMCENDKSIFETTFIITMRICCSFCFNLSLILHTISLFICSINIYSVLKPRQLIKTTLCNTD